MLINVTAGVFFAALLALFVVSRRQTNRLTNLEWQDLVAMLQAVPVDTIAELAGEFLTPTKGQIGLDPNDAWNRVGGKEGLLKMHANADILIALAAYASRWNFHESVIVTERMRHDAVALRRALFRLTVSMAFASGKVQGPFYLHQAVGSYHLMRLRLLALYESSHVGRLPSLETAGF